MNPYKDVQIRLKPVELNHKSFPDTLQQAQQKTHSRHLVCTFSVSPLEGSVDQSYTFMPHGFIIVELT